jgi:hypothetical protein
MFMSAVGIQRVLGSGGKNFRMIARLVIAVRRQHLWGTLSDDRTGMNTPIVLPLGVFQRL